MPTTRTEFEDRFRRDGLPLFIADRSARQDVWTRAMPLLAAVFWFEMLGAVNLNWSTWANVIALAGGLAILAIAWMSVNLARGRAAMARPNDIGTLELAGFVIVPALLPAVINGQTTSALVTAVSNVLLLGLVYAVIALGLISILRWSGRHLLTQLAGAVQLFARAIPLLLLFNLLLVLTNEVWQVFADMPEFKMAATMMLLLTAGVSFLTVQIPREVRLIESEVGEGPPLESRQRANVGLVMFVAQAVQCLVVTVAVWVFFVVFGFVAIDQTVVAGWLGHSADAIFTWSVGGAQLSLSNDLLRVAAAIAAFSGLYYAIAVLIDATYRAQFLDGFTRDMRETFALRTRYLAALDDEA